jgi:hypothetical protein
MNDHELDDQMRRLTQSYNEPPVTPREAMWERIERARDGRAAVPIVASWRKSWLRTGAGIAAVLVVGIGIGRLTHGVGGATPPAVASSGSAQQGDTGTARALTVVASATPSDDAADRGTETADVGARSNARADAADNRVRATRAERLRALRADRSADARGLAAYGVQRGVPGAVGEGSEMSAYRLAVVEHMARAEVLLTSFLAESRTSPTDARTVAQFASLSRDLLKTTRLLLATRTTDDPALTRLLEDLELVLMQISQYTSEGRRGDLDAINQSLDRRNVLPKLRSTIPAGASASTGI